MPMRCVTSRFRKPWATFLVVLWTALAAQADPAPVTLTLDQARLAAASALRAGDPVAALKLSEGLLKANPRDGVAHYLRAASYARLGQAKPARQSAARAYRFAETPAAKFQAAQLAARYAVAEERPSLAQIWLRRTAIHSPDDTSTRNIARDYQTLRRINPWSVSLTGGIRPSSNVNNGADSSTYVVDGVPWPGTLAGAAQALSGLIGTSDLRVGYRLHATKTRATSLSGRLYVRRVSLSSAAKAQAPTSTNSDFGLTYGELTLNHGFASGDPAKKRRTQLGLSLGDSWYGGERNFRLVRGDVAHGWQLGDRSRLTLRGSYEHRFSSRYRSNDADVASLGATLTQQLETGGRIDFSFAYREAEAAQISANYDSMSLSATYLHGRKIGPARLSATIGLSETAFPNYVTPLFGRIHRDDRLIHAGVTAVFEDFDYAGFAPSVSLRMARTKSNVSRFTTREATILLGIKSNF